MSGILELALVPVEKPDDVNLILGQSHFIKTVEDLYEAMVSSVPEAKFGIAFCEASSECLVRLEGNDQDLMESAGKNALSIGAGHSFLIFMRDCYPINVLNAIKSVQEVCTIFCATANPVEVVVAVSSLGRGIIGVIDGSPPGGIEKPADARERIEILRRFGYKRG
ncbi:MAG TPA: adenosine-specific kinase [Methanoregulaceae archaeon]|jgi:hypothetical protein|nr:adenosine-specific kinase [Methanolinea sp.]MDD3090184.1 adenosine-specific kinase [Methanoregulaceae archaeon]MDD5048490.1 adenosine-specific kinase [Methanoregulaceae archaeon]MDD5685456.1 adenosine-specific kinase [Methanoregulaceae archaeon]HOP66232.1 adenosine-specific kinase [Methanoregulaceae archaeon]